MRRGLKTAIPMANGLASDWQVTGNLLALYWQLTGKIDVVETRTIAIDIINN